MGIKYSMTGKMCSVFIDCKIVHNEAIILKQRDFLDKRRDSPFKIRFILENKDERCT